MVMNSKLDVLEKRMEQECLGKDDVSHFFESSRYNIKKMNGLIEALFFLSQSEETSKKFKKETRNMQAYFQEKKELYQQYYALESGELELDIEDGLTLEIEPQSFSILLDNLVQNAVKFSGKPRKIIIKVQKNVISIQDNGV